MDKLDAFLKRYKYPIILFLLAASFLTVATSFYFYFLVDIFEDFTTWHVLYWLFTISLLFLLVFLFLILHSARKPEIHHLFLLIAIPLGILYLFLFPPGTVPDEKTHLQASYRLSNVFLFDFEETEDGTIHMRQEDADYTPLLIDECSFSLYNSVLRSSSLFCRDDTIVEAESQAASLGNAPFGYIVPALGITVGRILHLGTVPTCFLGRLFNLLLFVFLVYFSIKKIPFGKAAMALMGTLPIALHTAASFSYDATINGLGFFLIAYCLYMAFGERSVSLQDIILTSIVSLILAPCKLIYVFLSLLILIVPLKRFCSKKLGYITICSVIGSGLLGLLLIQISKLGRITSIKTTSSGVVYYSISWIFENIGDAINLLINTIYGKIDFYFESLFGGTLGWFQISSPSIFAYGFFLLIVLACFARKDEPVLVRPTQRIWGTLIFFGISGLVLLSMMISWTPLGMGTIEGVQGRYFLPVIPLLILILRTKRISVSRSLDTTLVYSALCLHAFLLIDAFTTILLFE